MARNPFDPFNGMDDLLNPYREMERVLDQYKDAQRIIDQNKDIQRILDQNDISGRIDSYSISRKIEELRGRIEGAQVTKFYDSLSAAAKSAAEELRLYEPNIETVLSLTGSAFFAFPRQNELYPGFRDALAEFNLSLQNSEFLFYLSERDGGEGEETKAESDQEYTEESEEEPEEHLVDIISAETLQQLERVRFLPLSTLLNLRSDPQLMHRLSPRDFEKLIAELLDGLGYEDVLLTPRSGDGGFDVFATKAIDGIPIIFGVECKRWKDKIGVQTLRTLMGALQQKDSGADIGVLVTTSSFTSGAKGLLGTETRVKGRDYIGVVEWIKEYAVNQLHFG